MKAIVRSLPAQVLAINIIALALLTSYVLIG